MQTASITNNNALHLLDVLGRAEPDIRSSSLSDQYSALATLETIEYRPESVGNTATSRRAPCSATRVGELALRLGTDNPTRTLRGILVVVRAAVFGHKALTGRAVKPTRISRTANGIYQRRYQASFS